MIIRRYVLDLITGGDSFFKKEIHFSFCRNTEMEIFFFWPKFSSNDDISFSMYLALCPTATNLNPRQHTWR